VWLKERQPVEVEGMCADKNKVKSVSEFTYWRYNAAVEPALSIALAAVLEEINNVCLFPLYSISI